jgi:hypothetical protein
VYFAYLDLTLFHELWSKMKTPHNVFALLMISWLLRLRNGPTVITVEIQWADALGSTPSSIRNFLIQTPSFAASKATMYSASIVESATVSCLELFQLTAPPFIVNTIPDCDFESSLSVWKLASL